MSGNRETAGDLSLVTLLHSRAYGGQQAYSISDGFWNPIIHLERLTCLFWSRQDWVGYSAELSCCSISAAIRCHCGEWERGADMGYIN